MASFDIFLSFIGDYLDENLNRVLEPLGQAITRSGGVINEVTSKFQSPPAGTWIDEEIEIIEELLVWDMSGTATLWLPEAVHTS